MKQGVAEFVCQYLKNYPLFIFVYISEHGTGHIGVNIAVPYVLFGE